MNDIQRQKLSSGGSVGDDLDSGKVIAELNKQLKQMEDEITNLKKPAKQNNPLDISITEDLMSFGSSPDKSNNLICFDDPFPKAASDPKKAVNILDAEPAVAVSNSAELQIFQGQLQDITNALEKNKHL
eukprot:Seg1048.3 transcript_id=Seg1048.3/GoldUCD/mRNA.D3Y31 product="hypothetical protein" protein_id=Seg1048.3/GoldUCD/D3Y31